MPEKAVSSETKFFDHLLAAIASRDPGRARTTVARLMQLPPEAVAAMSRTPAGQIAEIPISLYAARD